MTYKHYSYTGKSKLTMLKFSKSFLAVLLALLMALSSLYLIRNFFVKVDAAVLEEGQTAFKNVSQFQKYRWAQIQHKIFGTDPGTEESPNVYHPSDIKDSEVISGNGYFDWVPESALTGVPKWDGNNSQSKNIDPETNTDDYDYNGDGQAEVKYTVYNVSTPEQFRYVMSNINTDITAQYVKLNLLSDLNMAGYDGKRWSPIDTQFCKDKDFKKYLYIEGNGHTIYNLRIHTADGSGYKGAGLFSRPPAFMIAKNLGFRSSMVVNAGKDSQYNMVAGLISAFAPQKFYFYNIHSSGGYYQVYADGKESDGGIGGLIGRKNMNPAAISFNKLPNNDSIKFLSSDIGDCFMKNCSTDNSYMYGSDHIGGLTSWFGTEYEANDCKYNSDFPSVPEQYVLDQNFLNNLKLTSTREDIQKYNHYPLMFENCSSTDCEIYSTGHDSGAMISCGRGLLVRNSFTNNKIYAIDNTGGFIGRLGSDRFSMVDFGIFHDENGNCSLTDYFENCYSSGVVEGKEAMGGFVGLDNSARARRTIYESATDSDVLNATGKAARASSAFVNCYSTAMVGMDYAGKYCGGFIGLDDNYNQGFIKDGNIILPKITVPNLKSNSGETSVSGCGNFYVNCYAGGEVGNILTVTDIEDAKQKEKSYLDPGDENKTGEGKNAVDSDGNPIVLDYYPTGGFVGAIGVEGYRKGFTFKDTSDNEVKINPVGNFYNCYYDMQTTAMHEMAVGLAKVQTYRDSAKNSDFRLTGVTGLYTEDSKDKGVPGLTGSPSDYSDIGGKSFVMDNSGESSSVWNYNEQYYPQLSVYMTTDTTLDDIQKATANDIALATSSKFYIPLNTDDKQHLSVPVYSLADSNSSVNAVINKDSLNTTALYAAQLAQVVRAFRFSQASTSTVLLNHWNVTMDTNSGIVGAENDWKTDVPANRMQSQVLTDSKGYKFVEWYVNYYNVQAGEYPFKVTTPNWTYNYGKGGNNGSNLTLEVPEDDCDVKIRFYCDEPVSKDFYVKADITRPSGESYTATLAEGEGYNETPYTVAGNFPGINEWTATKNDLYTMKHTGDRETYELTIKNLPPKKDDKGNNVQYYFKITNGEGWTENWGVDGSASGENMSFVLTDTADVTISFSEKTHICKVIASPVENLTNVITENKKIDFTGYSAVFSSPIFAGHYWLDKDADKVLEACNDGKLTYNAHTGLYERTFDVKITDSAQTNKNYSYKVIKDAVDKGYNHTFSINSNVEVGTVIKVKVTYNPNTFESTIASVDSDAITTQTGVSNYSVIGAEGLTGFNWMSLEAAKAGEMSPKIGSTTIFTKTYTNIPKGTYDFKVAADCIDKGEWSGLEWGGPNNSNYKFELSETADVEILFDTIQEKIVVKSPALVQSKWVLTGVKTLMGDDIGDWNTTSPLMTYNPDTGLYEYSISDVPVNSTKHVPEDNAQETPNYNYACKVIEYNNDRHEDNILFVLKEGTQNKYDLKFEYDEVSGILNIKVYDKKAEDVTSQVLSYSVNPYFYSVLGSQNLTGDSWGMMFPAQSAYNGWMKDDDGDGIYTKSYKIKLPESGSIEQYSFKVVANGTFNSGLSWGTAKGENIIVSVASNTISETTLTINFKPETGEVTYQLADDVEYSGDNIVWYVAGTYMLRSNNGYKVSTEVYDTVRDITSGFTFTSGNDNCNQKGVLWSKDTVLNTDYKFKDSLLFDLDYNQFSNGKENEVNTTFSSEIIKLEVEAIGDLNTSNPAEELIAKFNCSQFSPGKQWLTVTTAGYGYSNAFNNWKRSYLKYAEYIEKEEYYQKQLDLHLSVLSGYKYIDDGGNTVAVSDEDTLLAYLEKYSASDKDAAKELAIRFNLGNETLLTLKEKLEAYSDIADSKPSDKPDFGDTAIVGSRNIRLIPTTYLEAGNDARIEVRQPNSNDSYDKVDNDQVVNSVKYYSDDNAKSKIGNKYIDSTEFSYYNLAMTAGYLITDQVGLGVYSNYNGQKITAYNNNAAANQADYARDGSNNDFRNSGNDEIGRPRYFAMKSVFNSTGQYDSQSGKFVNQDNAGSGVYNDGGSRKTANLTVQNFKMQSTIGSAYKRDDDAAQTIVKIYKIVYTDGVPQRELVNTDSTPGATSDPALAYQKWTGQRNFVGTDAGDYVVQFCWTLSDGRYLHSEKNVTVLVYEPNIGILNNPKFDGATHFEREFSQSGSGEQSPVVTKSILKNDNTIKYQVTYSNQKISSNLTFAVLDILPFDGNKRVYTDIDGKIDTESYKTELSDQFQGFNLKNIKLTKSNQTTVIKGFYYTTSKDVQSWKTNTPEKDVAKKLNLTQESEYEGYIGKELQKANGGIFESFEPLEGETTDYSSESVRVLNDGKGIDNVTAIALTGVRLGIRDKITIEFEVEYNGVADDLILNTANYHAFSRDMETDESGTVDQSTIVSTTLVTRNLEGYAWLDSDKDGILDDGEPRLPNVTVKLYELVDGKRVPTDIATVTNEVGLYQFKDLPQGSYAVSFEKPSTGEIKVVQGDLQKTIKFNKLEASPSFKKEVDNVYGEDNKPKADTVTGSRNMAVVESGDSEEKVFGIPKINLPDNYSVGRSLYSHSDSTSLNYIQNPDSFVYNKTNMNAGFTYEDYSLTINKVDQYDNPVAGAEFMLEYKEGGKWYPVYYDENGYTACGNIPKTVEQLKAEGIKYIFSTDENGYLKFDQLFNAEYRFTEISTAEGLGKLKSPIYLKLPYEVPESQLEEYSKKYYVDVKANDNTDNYTLENGVRYYKHVTFKVSNPNNQFNLPQTGAGFDGLYLALIVGLVILGAGITIFVLAKKKKRSSKKI